MFKRSQSPVLNSRSRSWIGLVEGLVAQRRTEPVKSGIFRSKLPKVRCRRAAAVSYSSFSRGPTTSHNCGQVTLASSLSKARASTKTSSAPDMPAGPVVDTFGMWLARGRSYLATSTNALDPVQSQILWSLLLSPMYARHLAHVAVKIELVVASPLRQLF